MIRIKSDKIITDYGLVSGNLYIEGKTVAAVTNEVLEADVIYDMTGYYVSPGFIDIHTHGAGGYDFLKSEEDVVEGCNFHLRHGTTSLCPTISAAPIEVMSEAVKNVRAAMQGKASTPNILGAHLEGPYLSRGQCGAQCTDFIVPPIPSDYQKLVEDYGDAIARWTYAPENDPEGNFCDYITKHNIVASCGHSDATYENMCQAMEKGCNLVTHLYSCTSSITRKQGFRRLGIIETAMLEDDLYVEIIADGKHLPKELVQMILKIKGTDRVALVTDSLSIAGSAITHGFMVEQEFIVEDGVCKLMDRSAFCGSVAMANDLIRFMKNEVGVSICEAVKMLTKVPAEIMGLNKGSLTPGKDADVVVFDADVTVCKAFVMGREIF